MPTNTTKKSQHPFQVYLRNLSAEEREKLAKDCGSKYDYIRKLCGNGKNKRKPSPDLSKKLEKITGIDRAHFRPDIWDLPKKKKAA